MFGDFARELEGVASVVRKTDDFVALVVMAEDHEPLAERGPGSCDAQLHFVVGQTQVRLWERLPLVETLLFDLVEYREKRCHFLEACRARAEGVPSAAASL
jgi:hypothetical protein